jgi:hypothetical protein
MCYIYEARRGNHLNKVLRNVTIAAQDLLDKSALAAALRELPQYASKTARPPQDPSVTVMVLVIIS